MTIKDIIIEYSQKLEHISDTPRLDVEILLEKALGDVDSLYIRLNLNKEVTEDEFNIFNNLIEDRLNGRPIAYIVGNREFMGLDFYVQEGVLIPRPDTEILVEEVIKLGTTKKNPTILDLCTGSGAIAVSIAKYLPNCKVYASDISQKAIEIAKMNAKNNDVDVEFIKSDLFEKLIGMKFDIIVSNPPYIRTSVIKTLDAEVQKEPMLALDGGKDGLDFYRRIVEEAYSHLKYNSYLCFEIGYDQKEEVTEIINKEKIYSETYSKKDLYGNDRIIITKIQ
jgi:release factor glutamine methyltransferase